VLTVAVCVFRYGYASLSALDDYGSLKLYMQRGHEATVRARQLDCEFLKKFPVNHP